MSASAPQTSDAEIPTAEVTVLRNARVTLVRSWLHLVLGAPLSGHTEAWKLRTKFLTIPSGGRVISSPRFFLRTRPASGLRFTSSRLFGTRCLKRRGV